MNRSFLMFLVAFASVVFAPAARADLDSLLGDWANAASGELDSADDSDVSLTPPSAVQQLTAPAAPRPALNESRRMDGGEADGSTLTGHHGFMDSVDNGSGHMNAGQSHGTMAYTNTPIDPTAAMYHVPSPSVNPYVESSDCGCGAPSHDGAGCGPASGCRTCPPQRCNGGCGELITRAESGCFEGKSECRPHQLPNLPTSTFLDLFRSKNSYSNVWAGYAEETRLRVRNRSPHLDGTWRCNGCGAMLEPNQVGCGCGGGCDR